MPPHPRPLWDRFWVKVDQSAGLDACWPWTGARSVKRDGQARGVIQEGGRGSRILVAARQVCEWYHGPPPTPAHEACHVCHLVSDTAAPNALCCNPRHLQWGTREENEAHKQQLRA